MGNINVEKFRSLYETSDEYMEVRNNPKMRNVHLLCVFGSNSYGTARDDSDVDLRGIVGLEKEVVIGACQDWESKEFSGTDTVIYSYKRFLQLILRGNPLTLCLLGNDIDDYLILSNEGRELVLGYDGLVTAKPVYDSFIGYSNMMLKKLELAELGRLDEYGNYERASLIKSKKIEVLSNNLSLLASRYESLSENNIEASFDIVDDSVYVKNFKVQDVTMVDFFDMVRDLKNVSSSFGKKGKRNTKKTDFKLNKHCMHLVRGLIMGNELLETGKIVTYRKNDLDLLHKILDGKFMKSDGRMDSSFYELVDDLKKKADYALKHTVLPQEADKEKLVYFYDIFMKSSLKERK